MICIVNSMYWHAYVLSAHLLIEHVASRSNMFCYQGVVSKPAIQTFRWRNLLLRNHWLPPRVRLEEAPRALLPPPVPRKARYILCESQHATVRCNGCFKLVVQAHTFLHGFNEVVHGGDKWNVSHKVNLLFAMVHNLFLRADLFLHTYIVTHIYVYLNMYKHTYACICECRKTKPHLMWWCHIDAGWP